MVQSEEMDYRKVELKLFAKSAIVDTAENRYWDKFKVRRFVRRQCGCGIPSIFELN